MKKIKGQVRYCGPTIAAIGLHYGTGFKDGIYEHYYPAIEQCPAIGQLFVSATALSAVMRELRIDVTRKMRGTKGKYVTFYREVQKWLASQAKADKTPTTNTGVKLTHHA